MFKLISTPLAAVTKFGLAKEYSVFVSILAFNCCLVNLQTLPLLFCININSPSANTVSAFDLVISISILSEASINIPDVVEAVKIGCLVVIAVAFA